MSHQIKLIVGLGNPGTTYEKTRHNAGAWVINLLADENHLTLRKENKFSASVTSWPHPQHPCYLAIPTTYMNLSGHAVYALAHFYRIRPTEILILHDELDLVPGVARLKFGGGHGGHNGLKDIISHLQTQEFYRLRIGIGHPGHRDHVVDYVLSRPNESDFQKIIQAIHSSLRILPLVLTGEMEKAMHTLHSEA